MILRDILKQEIDMLDENQLSKIAEFIASIKAQTEQLIKTAPYWQRATPSERSQEFRNWVAELPRTGLSLPNEAFDRDSIYE